MLEEYSKYFMTLNIHTKTQQYTKILHPPGEKEKKKPKEPKIYFQKCRLRRRTAMLTTEKSQFQMKLVQK